MKKSTLALGLGLLGLAGAVAGTAYAQQDALDKGMHRGMMGDPMGNATVTRAEAQAKAAEMFGRMDANGDGKLDRADREARMARRFDALDANHDGVLSRAEFLAAHERGRDGGAGHARGGRMKGMAGRMLGMADANRDGAVSRDEFVAGVLRHFDMADANHDGKLTPQERHAAMKHHMRAAPAGVQPATPAAHDH